MGEWARRFGGLLLIAVRELRARFGRTALACASLVVGIVAITAVEATAGAARHVMIQDAELRSGRDGSASVAVEATPVGAASVQVALGQRDAGVVKAAFVTGSGARLLVAGQVVTVVAYAGDVPSIRPVQLLSGGWPATGSLLMPEVILNQSAAERAKGGASPRLSAAPEDLGTAVRVRGVMRDGEPQPRAYIPWQTLARYAGITKTAQITLYARDRSGDATRSASWITGTATRLDVPLDGSPTPINSRQSIEQLLLAIRTAFLVVGAVTLLVGVMGVLNIGLATLRERTEELGLRRSLGATRGDIATLILTEAILVGLAGAAVSVLIAAAAFFPITGLLFGGDADIAFPVTAAFAGAIAGISAGLLGGIIPAVKAARMSIATVMRA